jgi:hypothetical protein
MSYTNAASSQYAAALREETVTMTLGPLVSQQEWISFGRFARDSNGFNPQISSDAAPIPIPGGSAVSHSTFFGAFEVDCSAAGIPPGCKTNQNYLSVSAVTKELGEANTIEFSFTASIYKERAQTHQCIVQVTDVVVEQWSENRWLIAGCREEVAPSFWSRFL